MPQMALENRPNSRRRPALKMKGNDRLTIDNVHYRFRRKEVGKYLFQLVSGGLLVEDTCISKTEGELYVLLDEGRATHEVAYYSQALTLIRNRSNDNPNLPNINESRLRAMFWKGAWVRRYLDVFGASERALTQGWGEDDIRAFIESERDSIHRWYLRTFGETRPPGKRIPNQERKLFDYPAPSTLRLWLSKTQDHGRGPHPLADNYGNCGGRKDQLNPEVRKVLEFRVDRYKSAERPDATSVVEAVMADLTAMNIEGRRSGVNRLTIHPSTVYRHVNRLNPFECDVARIGHTQATIKWTGVGRGLLVKRPFERIEIDDWECDLHTLLASHPAFAAMTEKQKAMVPRIRCTVTIAIDVFTRMIVGWNLTPGYASTATAKAALKSIFDDKTAVARSLGATSDWSISGNFETIVSDGGPAFGADFEHACYVAGGGRAVPEQDPRKRGTIESFFRLFRRACMGFAGRTFSNVVEKGDYPSEALASVTVDQFVRAVVVFISDCYHHRPHWGLRGMTPASAWQHFVETDEEGIAPVPARERVLAAIGLSGDCKITDRGRDDLRHDIPVVGTDASETDDDGRTRTRSERGQGDLRPGPHRGRSRRDPGQDP